MVYVVKLTHYMTQVNVFRLALIRTRHTSTCQSMAFISIVTRAPPGSPAEHASPGGGVIFTPTPPHPVISGAKGRRGTREAAIESSRQDDDN